MPDGGDSARDWKIAGGYGDHGGQGLHRRANGIAQRGPPQYRANSDIPAQLGSAARRKSFSAPLSPARVSDGTGGLIMRRDGNLQITTQDRLQYATGAQ